MGEINGRTTNATMVPANENGEFDAELTISPDKQWQEPAGKHKPGTEYKGKTVPKPRASIVLHELVEIVKRTVDGCSYQDAHADAKSEEARLPKTDPRRSKHPGSGN